MDIDPKIVPIHAEIVQIILAVLCATSSLRFEVPAARRDNSKCIFKNLKYALSVKHSNSPKPSRLFSKCYLPRRMLTPPAQSAKLRIGSTKSYSYTDLDQSAVCFVVSTVIHNIE